MHAFVLSSCTVLIILENENDVSSSMGFYSSDDNLLFRI